MDRYTYAVLALLDEHGPLGLAELARRLAVTKPTASRHVSRLAAAGLVTSRPDRAPRAMQVVLTAAGDAQVARVAAIRRAGLAEALRDWPHADVTALAGLLGRLNAVAPGDTAAPGPAAAPADPAGPGDRHPGRP